MGNSSEENNRKYAESRANMGKDPGDAYGDLRSKHQRNSSGGGGGACFTAETEVLTASGWQAIASIRQGESILSLSGGGTLVPRAVLQLKAHRRPVQIWDLRMTGFDGLIHTTKVHRFFTDRGWLTTFELRPGDVTHRIDAFGRTEQQQVLSVTATESYEQTYNLVTFAENNFIVRAGVAHNFTHFSALRSAWANSLHLVQSALGHRWRLVTAS